nr:hypothetical protein [uncultured Allomuricauda sp.]
MNKKITFGQFIIENQSSFPYSTGGLSKLLNGIRLSAKVVNHEVNKAGLIDITEYSTSDNVQAESDQSMGDFAKDKLIHPNRTTLKKINWLSFYKEAYEA